MKKILALVLALTMILMVGASFADDPISGNISVTGLEAGDTVKYYKVIEWNATSGWQFTTQFEALGAAALNTILGRTVDANGNVTAISTTGGVITSEMAASIAALATTPVAAADTLDGTTWSKTGQAPGLYMVQAASAGDTIYNPVFVAVQADGADGTVGLPSNYNGDGHAKKSGTSIDKKAKSQGTDNWDEWTTEDVGDIIDFKIETLVAAYNETYTNPMFKVSDSMTSGLTRAIGENGALGEITVKVGTTSLVKDTDYTIDSDTAQGFVISFTKSYLTGISSATTVVITYQAKITEDAKTVNPEENTATIEYSRNPQDASDHGTKEDKTTHYTFDIDGSVTGNENYTSSEIIKVGVDEAGNPINEEKEYSNTTKHHPLAGAKFKIYTNEACTTPYTNATIDADKEFESSDMGLLNVTGLDEGTYWLKETKAVDGYMLITTPVKFQIVAEYVVVDATETCNAYKVLKGYEVLVNDTTTSTYTWDNGTKKVTLDGGVAGDQSTEVENPKGVSLPSTGGIGTTIFYILGGLLVVGAVVILVARRKAQD